MKKLLLILSVLLVSINGFAQFHFEDGAVYCDLDYLIIGRIQANFDDEMAVCQYPTGYAFMILEGDRELVTVALGETKEQAISGMKEFISLATEKVSQKKEHHLKDIDGNDVLMTVYPQSKDYLKNNVRLFCSEKNLGSGIILLNNLNYFNKILVKYPTVRFKERKQAER